MIARRQFISLLGGAAAWPVAALIAVVIGGIDGVIGRQLVDS